MNYFSWWYDSTSEMKKNKKSRVPYFPPSFLTIHHLSWPECQKSYCNNAVVPRYTENIWSFTGWTDLLSRSCSRKWGLLLSCSSTSPRLCIDAIKMVASLCRTLHTVQKVEEEWVHLLMGQTVSSTQQRMFFSTGSLSWVSMAMMLIATWLWWRQVCCCLIMAQKVTSRSTRWQWASLIASLLSTIWVWKIASVHQKDLCGEALPFNNYANVAVPGRDKWFIINMDQTPLYFSMHFKCMLEKMGLHTVKMLTSTNHMCYVTNNATITAPGNQFIPIIPILWSTWKWCGLGALVPTVESDRVLKWWPPWCYWVIALGSTRNCK